MNGFTNTFFDPTAENRPIFNLASFGAEARLAVIDALSLSMSELLLDYVAKTFASAERRAPTPNELRMLDEIIRIRKSSSEACRVSSVSTDDALISETYGDFTAKSSYLSNGASHSLSLEEMADIAPKYLNTLGFSARQKTSAEENADTRQMPLLQPNVALILLLPNGDAEYEAAVRLLLSDPNLYGRLGPILTVGEYGIAQTLCKTCTGAFGNLSALTPEKENAPSALTKAYKGRNILCVYEYLAEYVLASADRCGLRAVHFAKTVPTGKIFFNNFGDLPVCVDMKLINTLTHASNDTEIKIGAEEKAVFLSSVDKMTSALLASLASGAKRKDTVMYVSYTVPSENAENGLSVAASSMLGAYRFLIETCVASDTSVTYSSSAPSFSVNAEILKKTVEVRSSFGAPDNKLYFLSLQKGDNGMPDFASLRALCKQAEDIYTDRAVVSASAVNGNLNDVLTAMSNEGVTAKLCEDKSFEGYLGILIESPHTLDADCIGITVKK